MPLPTKNTAPPRELAPAGNHSAICIGHYHLGTQETKFGDKEQILLSFAIDEQRSDGSPHILSTNGLTLSIHEKSKLAGYIKTWIGKSFGENEEFDTASLVDRPCMVLVSHGTSAKGNDFADIDSITSLPKGMKPFQYDGNTFDYSPIDPSQPIPSEVPEWIGKKIQASREWVAYHSGEGNGAASGGSNGHGSLPVAGGGMPIQNPPEKPPVEVKPYVKMFGLPWPYNVKEMDAALATAAANPANTAEEIAEARVVLDKHVDEIPY